MLVSKAASWLVSIALICKPLTVRRPSNRTVCESITGHRIVRFAMIYDPYSFIVSRHFDHSMTVNNRKILILPKFISAGSIGSPIVILSNSIQLQHSDNKSDLSWLGITPWQIHFFMLENFLIQKLFETDSLFFQFHN